MVSRHGVPPLAARHLQEAIVGSALMHGSEVVCRGQPSMCRAFQRSINRVSRAKLEPCLLPRWPSYRWRGGRCLRRRD